MPEEDNRGNWTPEQWRESAIPRDVVGPMRERLLEGLRISDPLGLSARQRFFARQDAAAEAESKANSTTNTKE
jgi:hypothetical protein